MRVLVILILTVLGFYLLTVQWGILAFLCACGVGWLIKADKHGKSIESFSALAFGVIILGAIVAGIQALFR